MTKETSSGKDLGNILRDSVILVIGERFPSEVALAPDIVEQYLAKRRIAAKSDDWEDQLLGFGVSELVFIATPYITILMSEIVLPVLTDMFKEELKGGSSSVLEHIKRKLKLGQKERDIEPITTEQAALIKAKLIEHARKLKLPREKVELLSDAIVGSLLSTDSGRDE